MSDLVRGRPNEATPPDREAERAALDRLSRVGGEQFVRDLVYLYLEQSPERIEAGREAIRHNDLPSLAQAAHGMHSSSAQLGARALADACEATEAAAERGDLSDARVQFEAIEAEFAAFTARLATRAQGAGVGSRHSSDGTGPVIAVVEDNADNRLLVDAILGDRFVLFEYATGTEAIDGMCANHPDLVLLDVSLPGMDGLEVLERIRREPMLERVPIVALTAHAMSGDRERYLAAGFDDYIPKPIVDEAAFVRVIDDLLARDDTVGRRGTSGL